MPTVGRTPAQNRQINEATIRRHEAYWYQVQDYARRNLAPEVSSRMAVKISRLKPQIFLAHLASRRS